MPKNDTDSSTIYHHLSEIQRLHDEKDRLDRQIGDLSQKRREANQGYHHHVAAVEPFFEALPGDVVIELFGAAFWLDAKEGMCICKLRPWTDLVPSEPDPIKAAQPPIVMPSARVERGTDGRPVILPVPEIVPMSYAEQQAKLPYVPESIAITPAMETDAARRMAFESALMMGADSLTDSTLEKLTEAWDRDEDDAIERLVGTVTIHGNGEAR